MFDNFVKNRKFGNYTGRGIRPRWPEDEGYNRCRMRIVPFDYCFRTTREPITKSMCEPGSKVFIHIKFIDCNKFIAIIFIGFLFLNRYGLPS